MTTFFDGAIVVGVLLFFALIILSRVQNQNIVDLLRDIRDFIKENTKPEVTK